MNIVVTGGDGFIGKNLVKRLADQGHRVFVIDNHVTSYLSNQELMNVIHHEIPVENIDISILPRIDTIFHLASVASPLVYKNDFSNVFNPNVIGTQKMISLSMRDNSRLIFASTSEVYGSLSEELINKPGITEDTYAITHLLTERSIYPNSKRMGEELVFHHAKNGYNAVILRLFNVYGKRMDVKNNRYGRVIPNFIQSMKSNEPLTVFGDGNQVRCFLWIDDLIDALFLLMKYPKKLPYVLNIGNNAPCRIIDLARLILRIGNQESNIIFVDKDKDDPDWRRPDCSELQRIIDWSPVITLEEGIARIIQDA